MASCISRADANRFFGVAAVARAQIASSSGEMVELRRPLARRPAVGGDRRGDELFRGLPRWSGLSARSSNKMAPSA